MTPDNKHLHGGATGSAPEQEASHGVGITGTIIEDVTDKDDSTAPIGTSPDITSSTPENPTSSKPTTPPPDSGKAPDPSSKQPSVVGGKVPKMNKVSSCNKASKELSSSIGGQELMLHTSRATSMVATQVGPLFGQVLAQSRSGNSLGSLGHYTSDWNIADMGEVT
jgi:hypothetical protein